MVARAIPSRVRQPGLSVAPLVWRRVCSSWSRTPQWKKLCAAALVICALLINARRRAARTGGGSASTAVAVQAGAGVHGWVHKQGPLEPRAWDSDFHDWRVDHLESWQAQRREALIAGQQPPPLPLTTSCQVWVNHLYKVIYLRHAKTASSSVLCHFRGCREEEGDQPRPEMSFEMLRNTTGVDLGALWRDYLVVTFVRNAYQRTVSSYKMMMRNLAPAGDEGDSSSRSGGAYGWDDFCADPAGFADICEADRACSKKGAGFVFAHIQPQHHCIVTEGGGWAVDFIGRTESIDEDLNEVLQELERRRSPDAPPVKPLERTLYNVNGRGCNETQAAAGHRVAREQYCQPEAYYQGRHAACFDQVKRHYDADVRGLGFGSNPPPAASRLSRAGSAGERRGATATQRLRRQ